MDEANTYRVGFLLIDGFALMSYAAVIEPLRAANLLVGREFYKIDHLVPWGQSATSSSGAIVNASVRMGDGLKFDLVLVIAGGDPLSFKDTAVFAWLREIAQRGVILGGVSGGPVILALAGVMNDRRMTVHWEHAEPLSEQLPYLIIERSLYLRDRDRITCAGGLAPMDMMHFVLTEHHGPAFARQVSDWFMHTDIRPSGGPQRSGLVQRYGVTSGPVIQAIEAMQNHIADPLALNQVAAMAGVGVRQLGRLFKDKLNQSPMTFYNDLRLETAQTLLAQSPLPITEIALATGFSSSAHFASAFQRRYGLTPSAFRG